ncbi:PAS domain-containing protein [Candidatus Bathyarchaeota archaeon]|nr:PAS domain-containing protein [Candidatus Bathyarchaeota archaeon]
MMWVSSRYLSYRGSSVGDLVQDPWGSIHEEDREDYLKAWSHCLRTGEQFSRTVRIRRFDGVYRWFYARAVASRDKRGVIHHFLGSYMDIHDQHVAEIKAARQEQLAASEAKHKLLANLIPQIIFTATHTDGITSANDQWLSYTGQTFEDSLGLGFMDYVHPDDLAKCRIPLDPSLRKSPDQKHAAAQEFPAFHDDGPKIPVLHGNVNTDTTPKQDVPGPLSADGKSNYERAIAELTALASQGIIKVARDSNGRLSYTTEVRLRSKSGEYRWHLVRCVEIDNIDFGGGMSSYFGSATDVNDHKLLEAELKEAMDSKSRFLSNMSHEIRTPLIGISGMVSFLQDTELNEEQRDHTNTIQTSANSLLMIINDILDLSKVAAGMMKLKFEWFHTRALIEDVNELVSTMAIAKRLELNYIVDEDVPALVKGDKIRIRQVLLNVIGNAIKFTAEGEVFSRCKVYRGPGASSLKPGEIMLEFAIIDTGRGFSKEEAELIFKPFSQIDGSSTRQHGGSGLGLVISRQLVELHGGQMNGTAVPGEGSTFMFTAEFGLPTPGDYPDVQPRSPAALADSATAALDTDTVSPMPSITTRTRRSRASSQIGQEMEMEFNSSDPQSSGSSNLSSAESGRSIATERSPAPSVNMGLARFSEAAKATGHDISQVTLTMPRDRTPPGTASDTRPPRYSILIVCPQTHSREATSQHIATTIPKDVPYQITALDSAEEARKLLGADAGTQFTHVVLNLPTAEAIISLVEQTTKLVAEQRLGTSILVLSDTVQRQQVLRLAAGTRYEGMLASPGVSFVYKPVKPSRFAVIFDPDHTQGLSIDRNRSTAQRMVESQKASYLEIVKRMGNKGYMVLLVEDNPVNQKVLMKYLTKVGVGVDIAVDGVACTDMVFSKPYGYYSLILVGLSYVMVFFF